MDLWQSREGARKEGEKSGKRKQKGKLSNIFGEPSPSSCGQVVVVQGAAPHNVGDQRDKGGAKESKKIGSSGNSKTRGHPNVLFVVRGIR